MKRKGALIAGFASLAIACAPAATALGSPPGGSGAVEQVTAAAEAAGELDAGAEASAEPTATTSRLAGSNRYGTAASISKWTFKNPGDAHSVYLARGDVFADALAAGVLTDGPVLLVLPGCGAPPTATVNEINRLDPVNVIALGGAASVCEDTLQAAAGGRPTDRLAGEQRSGTAAAIAQHEFDPGVATVYLAKGADSPDAVAGGVLTDGPILLVSNDGTSVPAVTAAAIDALDPGRVVALGGQTSLTTAVLQGAADGRPAARVHGPNRWATSVAIAKRAFPSGSNRVYLARGDNNQFADAVVSGVLTDGPVLLVDGPCDSIAASVRNYLADVQPSSVIALGGTATICGSLLTQAAAAASPPPPPPPPPPVPDCAVVKCVALTFDDGPSAYTSQLVDTLDNLDVPATFFVVGQAASARPGTVKRTYDHGYPVQNHSWSHPEMNTLTRTQQLSQYNSTKNYLTGLGIAPTDMLRPPYGAWNANTRTLGVPLILWSIDTRDWENRNTATIRANVRNNIHPGAIVLQHDSISQSVAAVPGIVADLRARDYHFVTVEDLVPWAGPGDLVYSRGKVIDAATEAEPTVVDGAEFLTPEGALDQPPLD
ncbi:cell wall-binding repeat-containing protein [Ornithinimicrobium cryptoxanthini]|uniref:cell wall-binding repeat-containing protein n=1 Tax=Ornithinimicrobium cryptoxanthini TaxID=2934161 RepID=UPI0021179878|nr:cell wall-binding repeat-containing protein [Ornithinimicrobium cryptoxanthini]